MVTCVRGSVGLCVPLALLLGGCGGDKASDGPRVVVAPVSTTAAVSTPAPAQSAVQPVIAPLSSSKTAPVPTPAPMPTPAPTPAPTPSPAPAPAPTYLLTFDANDTGATVPQAVSAVEGQRVKVPAIASPAQGYVFVGWGMQPDGTGTIYAPDATLTMAGANTTLYAQFKAVPMKITQQGGEANSRLLVEWGDGSKQDIAYSADIVGWGNSYDFNPVVGGLAVQVVGGTRYIHTCYPSDYRADSQPMMTVTAGGKTLLNATTFRLSDRETSPLAVAGSTAEADEIRVTIKGRLVDVEADTEVELIIRADAPRMALTRSTITYTRPTRVARLYHQLVHAAPTRMVDPISYYSVHGGEVIDTDRLPSDLSAGVFYKAASSYYVGFLAPRAGSLDFLTYRDGPYYAAYKIVYDYVDKGAGDTTQSRGVATWGFQQDYALRLLRWSDALSRGQTTPGGLALADRGSFKMVSEAYQ